MMPQIVLLVAVGVIGVLTAPVSNPYDHDGDPKIRQGVSSTTNEKELPTRRPGQYENLANCGHHSCHSTKTSFAYPSSLDRHWAHWHQGQIPKDWVEPKTVPAPERGHGRRLPLGENTRSLRWSEESSKKFPDQARSVREQREARKLFTGHLHPAMQQAEREPKAPYDPKSRKAKALLTDLGPSTQQGTPPEAFQLIVTHQVGNPDADYAGRYTQQVAPPTTKQCEVIQSPLTFSHSPFSPFRTATIQTRHNLCHHVPGSSTPQQVAPHFRRPPEQLHSHLHKQSSTQHLDIDLNLPPD